MRDLFIAIQTALDLIVYHLGGAICSQCLFCVSVFLLLCSLCIGLLG